MLQVIRQSINCFNMDIDNVSNLIYEYCNEPAPKLFVVNTNMNEIFKCAEDHFNFNNIYELKPDLIERYINILKESVSYTNNKQLYKMFNDNKLYDNTIIIDKMNNKSIIFTVYKNILYPVLKFKEISYNYTLDFFLKYRNELDNKWFFSYSDQLINGLEIDGYKNNKECMYKISTTVYDKVYKYDLDNVITVKIKVNNLTLQRYTIYYNLLPINTKLSLDDTLIDVDFKNIKKTIKEAIFWKYANTFNIELKSMAYDSNGLYLTFDSLY